MTIAILPVRALRDGKRRLQATHSVEERRLLVEEMLRRVVRALADAQAITMSVVVSPDHELIAWVGRLGVDTLPQPEPGLNEGLEYARQVIARRWPREAIMVVLPDLPLIAAADVDAIGRLGGPQTVVVAPDRHGLGTNALWLPASAAFPFAFGENSFGRHRRAALALGLTVQCYQSAGTALDIDTIEDVELARDGAELTLMLP